MIVRKRPIAVAALIVMCTSLSVAGPRDLRASPSSPSVPRAAWHVELSGHMGVHFGVAGRNALALVFTDRPGYVVPEKVTVVAVDPRTGAVAWTSADLPRVRCRSLPRTRTACISGLAVRSRRGIGRRGNGSGPHAPNRLTTGSSHETAGSCG